MPYHIKDERTERLLRELARVRKRTMADVLRDALSEAMQRHNERVPLAGRLEPLRAKVRALGRRKPVDWDALKRANDEDWGEPN